jgi:hypothetical protein
MKRHIIVSIHNFKDMKMNMTVEFSKAVVLHSKRNGQEEHSNEIVLPQEEQHLKTMREISRECVWWW